MKLTQLVGTGKRLIAKTRAKISVALKKQYNEERYCPVCTERTSNNNY